MALPTRLIKVSPRQNRTASGFTLAESLMASVVLAVAVVGISGLIGASFQHDRLQKETTTATSLARQLMEEIVAKPFADPDDYAVVLGPEAGEIGRANFDNADDYHNLSESSDAVTLLGGGTLNVSDDVYTRQVSAQYRATPNGASAASGDFLLVTVTVTTPSGKTLGLSRLVSKLDWIN